jgi:6-phosphogluconolactonase
MAARIMPAMRLVVVAVVVVAACSSSKSASKPDAEEPLPAEIDAGGGKPPPDLAPPLDTSPAPDAAPDDAAPMPPPADGPAADATPATASPGPLVYVGGFRAEIDVFRLDMAGVNLTKVGAVANPPAMPSFFAWHPSRKFGYSVDESKDGRVVAYGIDQTTGMLTRLNDAPVMGFGPTYIALDHTGKWALTACWAGGETASIAVNPIGADGMVGPPADRRMFPVNGYAHFITTDPTNKYVFASINGQQYVAQYRFDVATGKLTENSPARIMRPSGSGPRHMAFHPNGKFAYLINEQGNTVTVYRFDDATGLLMQLQDIPTLPSGYGGQSSTAHILVHRSGKFVYGSNRGHDSIVIYGVDQASGMLTLIGHQLGVGAFPRNFDIDPTGTLLLSVGQNDGKLAVFRIDQNAGTLTKVGATVTVGAKPTYVGVVDVPAR